MKSRISYILLQSVLGWRVIDMATCLLLGGTGFPCLITYILLSRLEYDIPYLLLARVVLNRLLPQLLLDTVRMNCPHPTHSVTICQMESLIISCFALCCARGKCLLPHLLVDTMSDQNVPRLTCCVTLCQTKCSIPCQQVVRPCAKLKLLDPLCAFVSTQYPWQSWLASSTCGIPNSIRILPLPVEWCSWTKNEYKSLWCSWIKVHYAIS